MWKKAAGWEWKEGMGMGMGMGGWKKNETLASGARLLGLTSSAGGSQPAHGATIASCPILQWWY